MSHAGGGLTVSFLVVSFAASFPVILFTSLRGLPRGRLTGVVTSGSGLAVILRLAMRAVEVKQLGTAMTHSGHPIDPLAWTRRGGRVSGRNPPKIQVDVPKRSFYNSYVLDFAETIYLDDIKLAANRQLAENSGI